MSWSEGDGVLLLVGFQPLYIYITWLYNIFISSIVHGFIIEEIACANLLFEGLGNLPPGGFQIEEGQVEQTIPGTTLGTTLVDQTPSHFK